MCVRLRVHVSCVYACIFVYEHVCVCVCVCGVCVCMCERECAHHHCLWGPSLLVVVHKPILGSFLWVHTQSCLSPISWKVALAVLLPASRFPITLLHSTSNTTLAQFASNITRSQRTCFHRPSHTLAQYGQRTIEKEKLRGQREKKIGATLQAEETPPT
jgi:hypothetical protein